jgi:hypothetical protein
VVVDSPRVKRSHGMSRIIVLVLFSYPRAFRVPCIAFCCYFLIFWFAYALHQFLSNFFSIL